LVSEGEEAPEFTLPADDGKKVSLSDYRGKKIVLYFYPKDGTPGCTKEAIEFRDIAKEFEKENGIITLLSDPEGKVLDLYGVWKKKSLYGRTFMGTERTTFLIDQKGIISKIYRKVKVKGHAQYCLLNLKGSTTSES